MSNDLTQHDNQPSSLPPLTGQKVLVVDAHSLIHQLFHAIAEMTSPDGRPVNAVFGFVRDMLHILKKYSPDYLICAFDAKEPSFRKEIYPAYKAHRPELDVDIVPQIEMIEAFLNALGIPVLRQPGFEADDIMATIASEVERQGGECVLVTSDKDCRQLISDRVKLLNLRKQTLLDRAGLLAEWGITPDQVVDFQALVGDSSDNVPGVPKIGPKTASELLAKYGSLTSILEHLDELPRKAWTETLRSHKDQAILSRKLVELRRDVPLTLDWQNLRPRPADLDALIDLCHRLGFKRLLSELDKVLPEKTASLQRTQIEYRTTIVESLEQLRDLVAQWRTISEISVDTETTDIRPRWADLVGISLAVSPDQGYYIPIRSPLGEVRLPQSEVLDILRPILVDRAVKKIGQNLKYDLVVLRSAGVKVEGVGFDSMLADYLLSPGSRSHSLDELASRLLGHQTIKIESLIGKGRQQKTMDQVPVPEIAKYAAEDAILPWHLKQALLPQLESNGLTQLFCEVEVPLIEILAEMEYLGVRVDERRLAELGQDFQKRMIDLEREIHAMAGQPFNIASPKQLQEVLFDQLKLPSTKRTKTGISTDSEVLEELALEHPLPAKIIEYRQYAKLKNTYIDGLREMICPRTGRVHASFHQAVTATGRLSCSDPNLQNIPIRTAEGRAIRSAFVAPEENWVLLSADYSQIELRVLAHYSQDIGLCKAFQEGADIHSAVAAEVFNVPLDEVTPEMRRRAKTVNFGVIYGQTPFGLARQLHIGKDEAAQFIDAYFARYPGIDQFLAQVLDDCRRKGYVSTILGRKRYITGIRAGFSRQRNLPERTAINTVIQGSAADIIKLAMLKVHSRLQKESCPARMILQVHDELVFECPKEELPRAAAIVRDEMENVIPLRVPLKVDLAWGKNWADLEPLA
jgi:DNA polymerase-1